MKKPTSKELATAHQLLSYCAEHGLRGRREHLGRVLQFFEQAGAMDPLPELDGTSPVVLYFGSKAAADDFMSMVKQSNPHLQARQL